MLKKLTVDDLTSIIHRINITSKKKADISGKTCGLVINVLKFFLEDELAKQIILTNNEERNKKSLSVKEYFKTNSSHQADRYKYQFRISKLAEYIFNLQDVQGIDEIIARLSLDTIEATFAELACGAFLYRHSIPFNFVKPEGIKGENYDIEITTPNELQICCEVKSKKEDATLSVKTIKNSLKTAQRQLPNKKPGVIFLKIPEEWVFDSTITETFQSILTEFFRNSNRIVAIIVRWEEQTFFPDDQSGRMVTKFNIEKNKSSSLLTPEINKILELIEGPSNNNQWVDFGFLVTIT